MPNEVDPHARRVVSERLTLPLAEDIQRGSTISTETCPRRYCFWWGSHLFDWDRSPSEGCTFLARGKPPGWVFPNVPCCRAEPQSPIDHFEPNEANIEQDEIDATRWIHRCEQSREQVRAKIQQRSPSS